jgi:hypothetical protein
MTTNEVREVLKASPFTPFSLRLVDGSTVRIDHPEFALLPPGRRAIAIFPKDEGSGGLRYFDVGLVVGLELDEPKPAGQVRDVPEESE